MAIYQTGRAARILEGRGPGSGSQHKKDVAPGKFLKNVHAIWCIISYLLHKNHLFLSFFFFCLLFSLFLFFSGGEGGGSPLAAPLRFTINTAFVLRTVSIYIRLPDFK